MDLSAAAQVEAYLRRLRRRAIGLLATQAVFVATGAFVCGFAVASAILGPASSSAAVLGAWMAVGSAVLGAASVPVRRARALRGNAVVRLLAPFRPELASATRSAVELAHDPAALRNAGELVAAHAHRVRRALERTPVESIVPLRTLRTPLTYGGAVALVVGVLVLASSERSALGAYALFHPSSRDEGGVRLAAVIARTEAKLIFPAHVGRPAQTLKDPLLVRAPVGTTVEWTASPRLRVQGGTLEVGGAAVRMQKNHDDLRGRFVVRKDGSLVLRVRTADGEWLRDPVTRRVVAVPDQRPTVELLSPETDRTVERNETIQVAWRATDDVALEGVDLVIRLPNGQERRSALARYESERTARTARTEGVTKLAIAELAPKPSDRFVIHVEAKDGDVVSGPNVGRSAARALTVASDASRRAQAIAGLEDVLNQGLDALAVRLETPVEREPNGAARRLQHVREPTEAFAGALLDMTERAQRDAALYRAMATRVTRALTREARLHQPSVATFKRRESADRQAVEELEKDVLLLEDLLDRSRIEDAAALTRELEALRREIASLLAELRRSPSKDAERALMMAIERAEQRMKDLVARIEKMAKEAPEEFANLPDSREETIDALEAMKQAVERGDLDDAGRRLTELRRNIDALAQAIGSTEESFVEAKFGPRERALAEAMDTLSGLETEQRRLADRTLDVRRRAASGAVGRGNSRDAETARRLSKDAQGVRQTLERMRGASPGMVDDEAFDRVAQRLVDVQDALRIRDFGEARQMADDAASEMNNLARDLELSSLMFPGTQGQVGRSAREAQRAAHSLDELRRKLDGAAPRLSDFVDEKGRQQLRGDVRKQQDVARASETLAERLAQGPDGFPLLPEGADVLRRARSEMQRAERALGRGDPTEGAQAQEEAARQLTELREKMEKNRSMQRNGEGGDEGGRGEANGTESRQAVKIPSADDYRGPVEMRRKVLDAMRERAPAGYESAVQRYYEELLR